MKLQNKERKYNCLSSFWPEMRRKNYSSTIFYTYEGKNLFPMLKHSAGTLKSAVSDLASCADSQASGIGVGILFDPVSMFLQVNSK